MEDQLQQQTETLSEKRSKREKKIRRWEIITLSMILLAALFGGLFMGFIISEVKNKTALKKLIAYQPKVPTRLYDIHGELISELFREKRELVKFDEIPHHVINAFLAVEDNNFYNHFGIDFIAILRAAVKNLAAMRVVEGGSTLTQQLAKGLFTEGEKTLLRKATEAVYALQIEKEYSKQEILEMYLNQIYFGHGAYGIKSAARFYFDKEVQDLNVVESAILAALPKSPHTFSPIRSTHNCYERNRVVMRLMVENGYISKKEADREATEFWPAFIEKIRHRAPSENAFGQKIDKAPYFTDYVRQILINRFGEERVYNEGFKVYTTLDLQKQRFAQKHLWGSMERFDKTAKIMNIYSRSSVDLSLFNKYQLFRQLFALPSLDVRKTTKGIFRHAIQGDLIDGMDLAFLLSSGGMSSKSIDGYRKDTAGFHSNLHVQGAVISIVPRTGYINVMVGGTPFSSTNQFNRAIKARRQPGSAFKPFVYTAAIDSRMYASGSVELDAPLTHVTADGGTWTPENYEQHNLGPVSLRAALARSINVISVRIYDKIGPDRIIDIGSKLLKIPQDRFDPNPSLALGSSEVTPYEMATAFSVFANEGKEVIPFSIRYITDRDDNEIANIEREVRTILAIKEKRGQIQILPKSLNWIMVNMLRNVVDHGTAGLIRRTAGFRRPVAGKTGTTTNWSDAWFAGFTPNLTTVFWLGYDDRSMSLGPGGSGGNIVAPLYGRFMVDAVRDDPVEQFPPQPYSVRSGGFCGVCNGWPSKFCPKDKIIGGYYLPGFGARSCPDEKWEHWEYRSVNERYREVQGISEKDLRKLIEKRFLNGQNNKGKQNKG